ncbi:hypothetical protein OB13_16105 [Pontibacter sp. HJ8]
MKPAYLFPILLLTGFGFYQSSLSESSRQPDRPYTTGGTGLVTASQDTAKVPYVRDADKKKKKKKADKTPASKTTKITYTLGISRASIARRTDEGHHVEIEVMSSGSKMRALDDLQMIGSSGSQVSGGNFLGFDNIELPFEGSIRFKAVNKMNSAVYDREVRFVVKDPGRWVVRLEL